MTQRNPAPKGHPVIPSAARNLALIPSFTNQCGIPRCARNDSDGPSIVVLASLLAAILACNLPSLGQEPPGNPGRLNVDDEGVFEIFLAGRRVGSESFKIHTSSGKVEARAEVTLHVERNGKTVEVQSFPELVLDPQLHPLTYAWNQKGSQSSRLAVDFRGRIAKVRYTTINGNEDNREFELPSDVVILDDNVVHHFQLLAALYQAMGGGKQTFHVFVPQEALPSLLAVEDLGDSTGTPAGVNAHLRHLRITTDVTQIDLWVDDQQHIERVSVPSAQLEAIRKR